MKKVFLATGFAVALALGASAQTKKKVPPPPNPPNPPEAIAAPLPPPPPPVPKDGEQIGLQEEYQDFLKRNPSVQSVHWTKNAIIIVPKQGKEERYTLNEKGIREAEAKYGKLPQAPPPPPLPPAPPQAPPAPKPEQ